MANGSDNVEIMVALSVLKTQIENLSERIGEIRAQIATKQDVLHVESRLNDAVAAQEKRLKTLEDDAIATRRMVYAAVLGGFVSIVTGTVAALRSGQK